ncbi:nucleotidyltransferase [Streptomyces tardus]|uniref:nucleotidyltransferase n=1 Tax=Streptomyces tardus TaxID=2780544 RepID=UPI0027E5341E|nr:nucleotidyltransferase [Streptomyces tardus]
MSDLPAEVGPLLERFASDVGAVVPVVALWAHGSLALGDHQGGRSDLDLVALVGTELTDRRQEELRAVHRRLIADIPLARTLHCTYVPRGNESDAARAHPTWAMGEWFERPVTPVSRRELALGAVVLSGPPPVDVLPGVNDRELTEFIRAELEECWLPVTADAKAELWLQDIWVDLGMPTFARASVTLRDGRLITKGEALE